MRLIYPLFAILFACWLGVQAGLAYGLERGLLAGVVAGWVLVFAYKATGAHFAQDVVPYVLLPLMARTVAVKFFRAGRWLIMALTPKKNASDPAPVTVPTRWGEALTSESVVRTTLTARTVILGFNSQRVVLADLDDDRHLLITGITGEGKSTVALNILLSLLNQGPGVFSKMTFSFHEPKSILSLHFRDLTHFPGFEVFADLDDSVAGLEALITEMHDRLKLLGEKRVFSVDDLGLPHKLIIIDDFQLFYAENRDYEALLWKLASSGRQAGFHLVLLTPYGRSDVVSTKYRPNFRFISGFLPPHAEAVVGMPVARLNRYQFLYQRTERDAPMLFTPYLITPADIARAISAFQQPLSATDIAQQVFVRIPNCGQRTLLREGRKQAQALVEAGLISDLPFPFSQVAEDGGYSQLAREWAEGFYSNLIQQGHALPPTPGRAPQPIAEGI